MNKVKRDLMFSKRSEQSVALKKTTLTFSVTINHFRSLGKYFKSEFIFTLYQMVALAKRYSIPNAVALSKKFLF